MSEKFRCCARPDLNSVKCILNVRRYALLHTPTQQFRPASPNFYKGQKVRNLVSIFSPTRVPAALILKRGNISVSK